MEIRGGMLLKATVIRKTGFFGYTTNVKLTIDGEEVADLSNKQAYTITSKKKSVMVGAKQPITRGKEVEVREGDTVLIKYNPLGFILFALAIALVFISRNDPGSSSLATILSVSGLLMAIGGTVCMLKAGFLLRKVDTTSSKS